MSSLRQTRIDQEWALLVRLAQANPDLILSPERTELDGAEAFRVALRNVDAPTGPEGADRRSEHVASFRFPRFYPGTPIEGFLEQPVFHPNVDPANGFVCLWKRTQIGDTVVEAVRRLRLILCWRAYNLDADHIMQPAAADLARTGAVPRLACPDLQGLPQPGKKPGARRRLSPIA